MSDTIFIKALADYLVENGIGTLKTDMFIGQAPAKYGNCLYLINGMLPNPNLSQKVYDQEIEFWTRNKYQPTGFSKLLEVQELLHLAHHYEIGDYYVYFSNIQGSIEDNDVDIEGRKLQKLTIRFIYKESNLVS